MTTVITSVRSISSRGLYGPICYGPISHGLISYRLYDMVPYHIISLEKLDQSPSQVRQNPKNYNFWKSWFWLFGHGCLRRTVVRPGQRLEHDFGKIEGVTICHKFCHIARLNRSWRTNLPGFKPWAPVIPKFSIFWFCHELAISHVQTSLWLIYFIERNQLRNG